MNFGPDTADPSTPTLQSETRRILNDESTASSQQWSTADVKNCINLEYDSLRAVLGTMSQGWTLKTTLINTVADTVNHTLPTDFVGAELVLVEPDGKDIDSDSTAAPIPLEPTTPEIGARMYETGDLTASKFWYIAEGDDGEEWIRVIAPPGTGGTNALKIYYRSSSTYMSASGDAPLIPAPWHEVLSYGAALRLLVARSMPLGDVGAIYQSKKAEMLRVLGMRARSFEGQMSSAGLKARKHVFRFGRAQRPS